MDQLLYKFKLIASDRTLVLRLFFVLIILVIFRLGNAITIPGLDTAALAQFFANSQFFGLLNIFSGGGLSNLSIMMLGVGPYITATIIMQLMTMVFPALKEMYQEEGAAGRRKFTQYARILTVPLAVIQGFSLLTLLKNQGLLGELTMADQIVNVIIVTAGSMLLMWLGELITEYGIGNGVSLIIFAGIVARVPASIYQLMITFDPSQIPVYLGFVVAALAVIAAVVVVTEAERPIPVTYAKRVRGMRLYGGGSTYLPLRLNQAGVMPIIFALSILLFPQMIATFLGNMDSSIAQTVGNALNVLNTNQWVYGIFYFVLVFLFTYFYTAVTFDPDMIANNLQKSGAFIPGVRPGGPTSHYLGRIITRLTLVGAIFLGLVAILPLIMQSVTGIGTLAIGGTALLIVVSVALEFVKQIEAQVSMREY